MKYRLVIEDKHGHKSEVERVAKGAIMTIVALLRDNEFFPYWTLYGLRNEIIETNAGSPD